MGHHRSERPRLAGANRAGTGARPAPEYPVVPETDASAPQPTIEDRLKSKATAADLDDFAGQRSLGQLSRDERRKLLFGE
jgi:hypothetical protein